MTISEPTTLATDYLLGAFAAWLASRLIGVYLARHQISILMWACALFAVAAGSIAGGTYHGFQPAMSADAARVLWKVTTIAMGTASFFLLSASAYASLTDGARRGLLAAAAVKLVVYVGWMLRHDAFVFVMLDYGAALLVVLCFALAGWMQGRGGQRQYIAAGIFVSIVAALVQQSRVRLHEHFNHNDAMHVIQLGGVWLLYEGGTRLHDAGGPDAGQS